MMEKGPVVQLGSLEPGAAFELVGCPQMTGVVLRQVGKFETWIRLRGATKHQEFDTRDGKHVEFDREDSRRTSWSVGTLVVRL